MVLVSTSETEGFPCWICDLLTISLTAHNRRRRLVRHWTCWRMLSEKLVAFPTLENEDLNDAEPTSSRTYISRRYICRKFGTKPCTQMVPVGGMVGSHTGGSHGLHLEHHREAAPGAIKRTVFGRKR